MLRNNQIEEAIASSFDVIVIGGGITGAGIFLKASEAGLKTILIEKNDFASGTSSRSSKLIHGGLRYLAYFQIKLVYEGLNEREHLLNKFPHLVKPQPFFMPVYHSWVDRLKFSVGLTGYDMLQGKSMMPKHISIPKDEIQVRFPQIVKDDLKGGFIYYDARTNDARLTNEVIQMGVNAGGVAINYMEMTHQIQHENNIQELVCKDTSNRKSYSFKTKYCISSTGVWTDDILNRIQKPAEKNIMKPSKGIHVVVSGDFFPKDVVLILPSVEGDGRFIWCVPWEDNLCVIGTTDTEFSGDINQLYTTSEEVHYLLDAINKYLIGSPLKEEHILSVYAGLRPLLNDNEAENDSTSRSRDYDIWWVNDNFLSISGGKLTSFLSMAENVLIELKTKISWDENQISPKSSEEKFTFPPFPVYQTLRNIYGDENAWIIKKIIDEKSENALQLDIKYRYLKAEIIFFIRYQHAITLDDIFTRRTLISYNMKDWDIILIKNVCNIFMEELGWDENETLSQTEKYKLNWDIMHSWPANV